MPAVALACKVVQIGNCSGREVDNFAAFDIKTAAGSRVQAPLLTECQVQLECRVANTRMVRAYNYFVLEVVQAWQDTARRHARTMRHRGWGTFMVAGRDITLPSRMR